jgi:RNA polymerase sigma-70 factor, ECF subfamily
VDDSSPLIEDQDAELLQAVQEARDGDLRAFETLMEQHQRRIFAQEVFVKAFFAIRQFEGRSSFRHWLQRIKVHHCLNHLKKRGGKGDVSIDEEATVGHQQLQVPADAEKDIEAESRRQQIGEILNSMPSSLRIPLVMCDMDEMSYDEIATALGIGLSATKMRIKRAREQFRLLYGDETSARQVQA